MKEVVIDGKKYVEQPDTGDGYAIVRTYSAGVFMGKIQKREGKEVELVDARRLWRWAGAATLSQLATEGTKTPGECKFPTAVPIIILTEVIEILPCTQEAVNSIREVPVWTA
jgi:hypothetical protein